jgi:hypothetical protein
MLTAGLIVAGLASLTLGTASYRRGRVYEFLARIPGYGWVWRKGTSSRLGRAIYGVGFTVVALTAFAAAVRSLSGRHG